VSSSKKHVTLYWNAVKEADDYWVQVLRRDAKEWETIVVTI